MKQIGLFLFVCLLCTACSAGKRLNVAVTNHSSLDRTEEIVEIPWTKVSQTLTLTDEIQIIVVDETGKQLPYQLIKNGGKEIRSIIFPATVAAGKTVVYSIKEGIPEQFEAKVYGRFVPERKDDFAWENNTSAFRMYGPALEATGEISNGIDLWVKKTDKLVIDKWYKNDLAGVASYHEDHGEGLDFYKVGRTLGLGGSAPFVNDTIWLGNNFTKYEIVDKGPLRITFRLFYAPFEVDGKPVTETRTISLDANSRFNKIVEHFDTDIPSMKIASGIVLRPEEGGSIEYDRQKGYAAYAEPKVENGIIYVGVVSPVTFREIENACGHLLCLNEYKKGDQYTYYAGGSWDQAGFLTPDDWFSYVKDFAVRVQQPLKVTIE
ncbi:DUF4861 domain-containing protein [Parabacteroides pacaensis]|uniref:DUF4861 domain-containing protein n=1 Tax=Parabacteroides pacaensis TaxID=2086575 RepID=UPI000D0E49A2|nr:DUF4861 domain-containing protein [Parabacteroides pacaensis]